MNHPHPPVPDLRFPSQAKTLLAGLTLSALLAVAAIQLGSLTWLQSHGLSALTLAILAGIALGNTLYPRVASACDPGAAFSRQILLRLGIVLYGFRLSFQDIAGVGASGVAIDALVLCSTLLLAVWLGTRLFRLERNTAILIGAGSAICGAAAVMATAPVVRGRAEQTTVAVSTVVVFGTLAIALYPLLYRLAPHWPWLVPSPQNFGIYAGSTIHEVAQVVAVARGIGPETADAAVITKMVRVMMLAPTLLLLSAWRARDTDDGARRISIPWFAFAFIALAGLNSVAPLPHGLASAVAAFDTLLLAMAMAALGLSTRLSAVRSAGLKPLLLAALLFAWLVCGGAAINHAVMALRG